MLNVRLAQADQRRVRELKKHGINVSAIVRRALKDEVDRLDKETRRPSAKEILTEMVALYPDTDEERQTRPHPLDRKAFAKAFAKHVRVSVQRPKTKARK